jgi:hypothetical protein
MANTSTRTYQKILDGGQNAVIKVTETFQGANDTNTILLDVSSLKFANVSQNTQVSIAGITYSTSFSKGGSLGLYWASVIANTDMLWIGGTQSGSFNYMPSPVAPDSAMGNVGIVTTGTSGGDCFTIYINVNKEKGFSNAFALYN